MEINISIRTMISAGVGLAAAGVAAATVLVLKVVHREVGWKIPLTAGLTAGIGSWLYDWWTERHPRE